MLATILAATSGDVTKAGKAIGLALGVGLGAAGAGVGIGLIFSSMIQSVVLAVVTVPVATAFYLFEVVIVVSIQAFIFAALSAIYIGSAIEPEH